MASHNFGLRQPIQKPSIKKSDKHAKPLEEHVAMEASPTEVHLQNYSKEDLLDLGHNAAYLHQNLSLINGKFKNYSSEYFPSFKSFNRIQPDSYKKLSDLERKELSEQATSSSILNWSVFASLLVLAIYLLDFLMLAIKRVLNWLRKQLNMLPGKSQSNFYQEELAYEVGLASTKEQLQEVN
jgi:hypothetical protein